MSEDRESYGPTGGGEEDRGAGRRRFIRRPRLCQFCAEKVTSIDYKQTDIVKRAVTEQGKMRPRRDTGTCAKHQRMVAQAVKRARHMALVPFKAERIR